MKRIASGPLTAEWCSRLTSRANCQSEPMRRFSKGHKRRIAVADFESTILDCPGSSLRAWSSARSLRRDCPLETLENRRMTQACHKSPTPKLSAVITVVLVLASAMQAQNRTEPVLVIQEGHSKGIHCVAFSSDGRTIASGGDDEAIKLWEADTGHLIRNLEGQGVTRIAFSPDGKTIASGGSDKTTKLWDALTGKLIRTLGSEEFEIKALAFSPDGKTLASAGGPLKMWDVASGRLVRTIEKPKNPHKSENNDVASVAYSSDGMLIATGNYERIIDIWDAGNGRLLQSLQANSVIAPESISFKPKTRILAVATADATVDLWDVQSGGTVRTLKADDYVQIEAISFTPDGARLFVSNAPHRGTIVRTLDLWDVANGTLIRRIPAGDNVYADSVSFRQDGKYLATASLSDVRLYETESLQLTRTLSGHKEGIVSVAFAPDFRTVVTGGTNGFTGAWDLSTAHSQCDLEHKDAFSSIHFSPGQELVFLGNSSNLELTLWDLKTCRRLGRLNGEENDVENMVFSPDGNAIAFPHENAIHVYDTRPLRLIRTLRGHTGKVNSVIFSPDGKTLASASSDKSVKVWDRNTGALISALVGHNGGVISAVFSADGKVLASASQDSTIRLWNTATGQARDTLSGHTAPVYMVAFSPDGKTLASGSSDHTVRVWDVQSGRQIRVLEGYSWIESLTLSPNGRALLTSENPGTTKGNSNRVTVKLWNLASGQLIRTVERAIDLQPPAFSGNGKTVMVPYGDPYRDSSVLVLSADDGSDVVTILAFDDRSWIAYTPQGYYCGTEKASRHVAWRVDNNVYDFDQFFDKFFEPGIIAQALLGKKAEAGVSIARNSAPPPKVTILSPHQGDKLNRPDIEVVVEVRDAGGGIGEIRLYQNGKVVESAAVDRGLKDVTEANARHYRVSLLDGKNLFRVIAFSKDRVQSTPEDVSVELAAPAKPAALHVLAVGINRYKNSDLDLNFPLADAAGVSAFFRKSGSRLFREVNILELHDAEATRAKILEAFQTLRTKAQPQDVVVVYFAGHGVMRARDWYFLAHEITHPEDDQEVTRAGVSAATLAETLKSIQAQKVLLLLDACRAGGALAAFRGVEDRKALEQLARSSGIYVVAASTKEQQAVELAQLGHGVFTYVVLKGLEGEAMANQRDRQVTAVGLVRYIDSKLPEISEKYKAQPQYPVITFTGMDFPLALTK